jgi:hypothetical protein
MKSILAILFVMISTNSFGQDEQTTDEKRGFDVERMFAGGSLNIGLGGGSFNLGANPQIGYSLNNWLDAGLTTNVIYYSQRYNIQGFDVRQRSWNYGGGPFIKVFPISMIHLQAQYEYNWISGNVENLANGVKEKFNVSAPSVLIGAGYGRRIVGETSFFTTILFDITKNENSPYVYTEGQGRIALPVLRAGLTFYFRKKNR